MDLLPLNGIQKNDAAPVPIGNSPFLDLLQGSKATQTGIVIVQAAIAYARGGGGAVDAAHCSDIRLISPVIDWTMWLRRNPRDGSQRSKPVSAIQAPPSPFVIGTETERITPLCSTRSSTD